MPREIYLVKVGMSMTEGMVAEWYIPDGGKVNKGELVYALETEKINLDVDAESDGTVKHLVEIGVMLKPGDVVGYIFEAGEDIPADLGGIGAVPAAEIAVVESSPPATSPVDPTPAPERSVSTEIRSSPAARRLAGELGVDYRILTGTGPGGRIIEADVMAANKGGSATRTNVKASPLAKRLAAEKGIDITRIQGTGPGGRIVQADIAQADIVQADIASASSAGPARAAAPQGPAAGERVSVRGMRRTIASRMHQSLQQSAQLTMDMEANMDDTVRVRNALVEEWAAEGIKPTYTDLVIKAVAKALQAHPLMNSQFMGDEIVLLEEIHVGMAVALPEGLVVPVVRHADQLSVKELARESSRLASAARDGSLGLDDYAGGTFTVTALGMYGVDSFTPILNEPQSGILGVNRIYDGLEWDGDKPVKTKKMNLSLTWDHRALDGAPAAEFLVEVCSLLAAPWRLLV
ncbi:MAG: 2-oxo acid dehydrogenase subunit E2 [Gammaproteobacteria bacterium]|jgi:pyruvate dehydrogenase E2 component (dihydrolipoamide acetyltransferase)|nr:2-oxo acid dehydrogenase subunit E2 [Gammaproteobacteria bacterium]MBT4492701.1 2-oxo acid dehydrogenase subunit E2 [Gammaproteobacteria bacterium]MBT7371016.1 2-oxo acid dehydrogenase subunit E2 [Gammaproteobacteria bacterium]